MSIENKGDDSTLNPENLLYTVGVLAPTDLFLLRDPTSPSWGLFWSELNSLRSVLAEVIKNTSCEFWGLG